MNHPCSKIGRKLEVLLQRSCSIAVAIAVRVEVQHVELGVRRLCQTSTPSDQVPRGSARTDADGHLLRDGPVRSQALSGDILVKRPIHRAGHALQCHLAERDQIASAKEVGERTFSALQRVNVSSAHAGHQRLRCHVADHDLVGTVEHPVRHGLAHGDAGQRLHTRRQTFNVLDVDRGQHIDFGVQQSEHILVALWKPAALHVRMGEFINQGDLRLPCQDRVDVHLLKQRSFVVERCPWHLLDLLCKRGCSGATMRFHDPDHDIFAPAGAANPFAQHHEGLSDSGRIPQKDLKAPFLPLHLFGAGQPILRALLSSVCRSAHEPIISVVNSERNIALMRWVGAAAGLAAITLGYDRYVKVNTTTVALTYLLFVLFLSTRWGLRYAIAGSLAATACYNFFFLPPVHTFTVSDPQNLVALLVLLITSVVSSRMSERVREESRQALVRQSELEVLYSLSRALIQTDELSVLTNTVPSAVARACRARSVVFYLLQGDKVYLDGTPRSAPLGPAELRALANASSASWNRETREATIPLRTGVRPRGVLLLNGVHYSLPTLEAVGGLVSVSLDRAQAVDEVTKAEAAKESERLRTMMMDSITHEFRSPLTAIKVSVSTLRTGKTADASSSELLAIIEEETDRLDHLVTQSVEMAKLDTLEVSMTLSPLNARLLLEQALGEAASSLLAHPVTMQIPSDLPMIEADPEWLIKLTVNLLENAAKYSKAGDPIFITAEPRGDVLAISIADRGVGIDPLEQELIFDKFYRSRERAGHVPGTGMGLAIGRAIANAHGGTIEVTSQPGQGSVFTFTVRVAGH